MTELIECAAAAVNCDAVAIGERLAQPTPQFEGDDLLPDEILTAWPALSNDAKAVAILFAKSLSEEDGRRWDRCDRL